MSSLACARFLCSRSVHARAFRKIVLGFVVPNFYLVRLLSICRVCGLSLQRLKLEQLLMHDYRIVAVFLWKRVSSHVLLFEGFYLTASTLRFLHFSWAVTVIYFYQDVTENPFGALHVCESQSTSDSPLGLGRQFKISELVHTVHWCLLGFVGLGEQTYLVHINMFPGSIVSQLILCPHYSHLTDCAPWVSSFHSIRDSVQHPCWEH